LINPVCSVYIYEKYSAARYHFEEVDMAKIAAVLLMLVLLLSGCMQPKMVVKGIQGEPGPVWIAIKNEKGNEKMFWCRPPGEDIKDPSCYEAFLFFSERKGMP